MRSPSLLLLLAAGCGDLSTRDGARAPDATTLGARLYPRDQSRVEPFVDLGEWIAIPGRRTVLIDASTLAVSTLEIPGIERIHALCPRGPREILVAGVDRSGVPVLARGPAPWRLQRLPPEDGKPSPIRNLVSDGSRIWILTARACREIGEDGAVLRTYDGPDREPDLGLTDHVVFAHGMLYCGIDRGEWGGALQELDLGTGKWSVLLHELPVVDLKVGPDGRLWVVEGINHLGHQAGTVRVHDGSSFQLLASVTSYSKAAVNWIFGVKPFEALAFDAFGDAYLLAQNVGVLKWDGARWQPVVSGWPEFEFDSRRIPLSATRGGLHITRSGTFLVGLGDAGVMVIDRASPEGRRLELR